MGRQQKLQKAVKLFFPFYTKAYSWRWEHFYRLNASERKQGTLWVLHDLPPHTLLLTQRSPHSNGISIPKTPLSHVSCCPCWKASCYPCCPFPAGKRLKAVSSSGKGDVPVPSPAERGYSTQSPRAPRPSFPPQDILAKLRAEQTSADHLHPEPDVPPLPKIRARGTREVLSLSRAPAQEAHPGFSSSKGRYFKKCCLSCGGPKVQTP